MVNVVRRDLIQKSMKRLKLRRVKIHIKKPCVVFEIPVKKLAFQIHDRDKCQIYISRTHVSAGNLFSSSLQKCCFETPQVASADTRGHHLHFYLLF